ncbi:Uma2 family endonuclease [Aureimonas flava]|uniref:Uma2 family endonuclease n=1 Tax=Aureimonas flava TaxID=2320271 RepID=A0A3A1WMJ2_9HYPH|nr:Uma2 family endonuclease [Aureimonas flava]RIY02777.1 Uma2 family endonuclease [Aureimonas flava]
MSVVSAVVPWTTDAFLDWQAEQDDRYELVDGFPLKMMTGATRRHDLVVVNILVALRIRLRNGPCIPFTADGAVETRPGQIRRPDVGVDCGPTDPDARIASEPTVVFEVLSPSTRDFDRLRKIGEYKSMPLLRHIVLMEPDRSHAVVWSRIERADWEEHTLEGMEAVLPLPGIAIELRLDELYEGVLA